MDQKISEVDREFIKYFGIDIYYLIEGAYIHSLLDKNRAKRYTFPKTFTGVWGNKNLLAIISSYLVPRQKKVVDWIKKYSPVNIGLETLTTGELCYKILYDGYPKESHAHVSKAYYLKIYIMHQRFLESDDPPFPEFMKKGLRLSTIPKIFIYAHEVLSKYPAWKHVLAHKDYAKWVDSFNMVSSPLVPKYLRSHTDLISEEGLIRNKNDDAADLLIEYIVSNLGSKTDITVGYPMSIIHSHGHIKVIRFLCEQKLMKPYDANHNWDPKVSEFLIETKSIDYGAFPFRTDRTACIHMRKNLKKIPKAIVVQKNKRAKIILRNYKNIEVLLDKLMPMTINRKNLFLEQYGTKYLDKNEYVIHASTKWLRENIEITPETLKSMQLNKNAVEILKENSHLWRPSRVYYAGKRFLENDYAAIKIQINEFRIILEKIVSVDYAE